jgi:pyruvate dehydrogenase E2 component (dihydrolipoamide acetyltransferase)
MAERTAEAWRTIPHFYLVRDADASKLIDWRESLRSRLAHDVTYTDLLVKKVATCLRSHPQLTSEWRNGSIQPHPEVNVGLAVAVDQGLVVPVIRNADKLTPQEIATERKRLIDRAQSGKLGPDDLSGGTFTISNLGMYGVDFFQAIVNPPQAAILAVGRIVQRVVPIENLPAVRPMMTLGLSCDHRLVDGAHAARFLGELATSIEQASPA